MGYNPKISRVSQELLERMKLDPVEFTRLLAEDEARRHSNLQECGNDPLPYNDLRIEVLDLPEEDSVTVEQSDTRYFPIEVGDYKHTPKRVNKPWYRGRDRW